MSGSDRSDRRMPLLYNPPLRWISDHHVGIPSSEILEKFTVDLELPLITCCHPHPGPGVHALFKHIRHRLRMVSYKWLDGVKSAEIRMVKRSSNPYTYLGTSLIRSTACHLCPSRAHNLVRWLALIVLDAGHSARMDGCG